MAILGKHRKHHITGIRGSIELNDNRISRYVTQNGKCRITGVYLELYEIHCHLKKTKFTKNS